MCIRDRTTTKGTAKQVCVGEGASCQSWQTYATSFRLTLSAGDGQKMVRAWLKDAAGNVSAEPASATVTLDTTAPAGGLLNSAVSSTRITWTWNGFTDAASGVASYKLMTSASQMPSGCQSGTAAYTGAAKTFSSPVPAVGRSAYYMLCAVDGAGNVSAGVQVKVTR